MGQCKTPWERYLESLRDQHKDLLKLIKKGQNFKVSEEYLQK